MKHIQVLRDPEAFQLLADGTRRKILYLLRVKEMTVSQLSSELDLTPQALYHHVKKLLEGGMIEVVREERVGHLIESYYRATAEDFLLMTGKIGAKTLHDKKLAEEQVTTALNALKKIGFKLEFDKSKISQIVELQQAGLHECCGTDEKFMHAQDEIWNIDDVSDFTKMIATDFAATLLMSDEQFDKQQENRKKLRDLLLPLAKK